MPFWVDDEKSALSEVIICGEVDVETKYFTSVAFVEHDLLKGIVSQGVEFNLDVILGYWHKGEFYK